MRLLRIAALGCGLAALAPAGIDAAPLSCNRNAPDIANAGASCANSWLSAHLRLNQLQMVGTAESYKLAPSAAVLSMVRMGGKKDAEALDFSEPPLTDQLDAGARALSFDVAYDPKGGLFKNPALASMAGELLDPDYVAAMSVPGFKVIHVLDVDYRSSCLTLKDCLDQVAAWSRGHKNHMPIVLALHTNDTKTPMPGATRPQACDAAALEALEGEIKAVFKPNEIITPSQVMGAHATLREAVQAGNWPTLAQARGKVIFLLDDSAAKVAIYAGPSQSLAGKTMFVTADEASPLASFIAIDDPVKDAARIDADVKAGFIVRTRADDETVEARAGNTQRRDAAFASGAQIIQTDFLVSDKKIGAYQVSISDPRHVRCDSAAGLALCASWNMPVAQPPLVTAAAQ
jgi:hypothetical protein